MRRTLELFVLLALASSAVGYYLPGTYPQEFLKGDIIQGKRVAGADAPLGRCLAFACCYHPA